MESFRYKAALADGTILFQEGFAQDKESLKSELEEKGVFVLDIWSKRAKPLKFSNWPLIRARRTVPARDLLNFNQELLEMLKAGLHLVTALDLLVDRTDHPILKSTLREVRASIVSGSSLADALAQHPSLFSKLHIESVRAGEQSGSLPEILKKVVAFQTAMLDLRNRLVTSLSYPVFLFIASLFLIFFLIGYVLPTFSEMYSDFNAPLPRPTQMLLAFSLFLTDWYLLILVGSAGIFFGILSWYKTSRGRIILDGVLLKIPLIGPLLSRYSMAQFTQTLSTIISGGIPLVSALTMTGESLMNRAIGTRIRDITADIRSGLSLSEAMRKVKEIPKVITQMVSVGEAAGSLEVMLQHAGNFQEKEIETRLSRLMSLIEPILMLMMGTIIGAIVIMTYLPIFSVVETIR